MPFLQPNLPATLRCLSHIGQFKAICPHAEEDRGFSPAVRAQRNARLSLAAVAIGAAGREQPAGTPLPPASSRFPPPGLCARCRTAPRPSPARLPREAARPPPPLRVGLLLSPPARPKHGHGHGAAVRGLATANGRAPAAWGRAGGAGGVRVEHPRCPSPLRRTCCKCHQGLAAKPGAFQPHMVGGFRCQKPAN